MNLFKSSSDWKSEVASLGADLESANTEIESLRAQLGEAQSDLATARETIAEAPSADAITELERQLATANAAASDDAITARAVELVSAESPVDDVQRIIAQRVTEQLASAGQPAPVTNVETDVTPKGTISRSEFAALSTRKKAEHVRNGGKLTD